MLESSNKISARFNVACVVKIKLFFMDWFYYNLIITNYVMQNTMQKFRQSFIVFEKPGISSENLKTMTSSNYPTVQYFFVCGIFFNFI